MLATFIFVITACTAQFVKTSNEGNFCIHKIRDGRLVSKGNCENPKDNLVLRDLDAQVEAREWSQWSQWSGCSATCGVGTRRKTRSCGDVTRGCKENSKEEETCSIKKCPAWAKWGQWSTCSVSCGAGERSRLRTCENGPGCVGNSVEKEMCNNPNCSGSSVFSFCSYNIPTYYIGLNDVGDPSILKKRELFRVVSPGLQGTPGTISFESVRFPGRYLRHSSFLLHLRTFSDPKDELFKKEATFWPRKSRFFPEFTAYESFNYPRYFIRHQYYRLKLHTEPNYSDLFKKDASFFPLPGSSIAAFRSYNLSTHYIGLNGNGEPSVVKDREYFQVQSPGPEGTPGTVSFESVRSPGMYLRHSGFLLHLQSFKNPDDELFKKDATYFPRKSRFFPGFTAYESFNVPKYFIRHQYYRLKIATEENYSDLFKKDASFKLIS